MPADGCTDAIVDVVERLIREEVAEAMRQRRNWKLTVHGSAAGDVRVVVEQFSDVLRHGVAVTAPMD
jgi:hypothetical protein